MRIEEYALIGDTQTVALVSRDGRRSRPRRCGPSRSLAVVLAATWLLFSPRAHAEDALTVDQALGEARVANALLPLAALDVASARERVREAKARRWLQVSVEAGLRYAPPSVHYGSDVNGESLQAVLIQPLYAGDAIDARVRAAEADVAGRAAGYRVDEKSLELDVRLRFARYEQIRESLALRREGLRQLERYVTRLEERKAAGQPVTADLLKTRARVLAESATIRALERQLAEVALEINDLLGRVPEQPLVVAPLPDPGAPDAPTSSSRPWQIAPDVRVAASEVRIATQNIDVAAAAWKPHVSAILDAGLLGGGIGATPSWARPADRLRNDAGVSAAVSLSWVVFDLGIISAQVAQARLARDRTAQSLVVAERNARLEWSRAHTLLVGTYEELQVRARALPVAHDAYLEAESTYRGGQGSALEVLDAYANWIGASDAHLATKYEYRAARAALDRWGSK